VLNTREYALLLLDSAQQVCARAGGAAIVGVEGVENLAVLAELGSVGFLLYILLIVGGALKITVEALRSRDAGSASGAAFLWSYMSIGFTENLALATGLVMPLAMIFVTARAWAGGAAKR